MTDATLTTGTISQPMQYTGEQRDSASSFMYLRARMYDPNTGRFMQADPMRKSTRGIMGWNRYSYATDNPTTTSDHSGLCRDPAGPGIRYCLERFVPTPTACLVFCFVGDNPGTVGSVANTFGVEPVIKQNPDGSTTAQASFGLSIAADETTRAVLGQSAPGEPTLCYAAMASGGSGRTFLASCGGVDGLLARAGYLYFGIKTNVLIQESTNRKARVLWARGTPYPCLEVYQYDDADPFGRLLYYYDASKAGPEPSTCHNRTRC